MFGRIAAREDVVEGFAICVVHEGSWSVRPTCYLEDLFVEPAARGVGVGRALLDDLVFVFGLRLSDDDGRAYRALDHSWSQTGVLRF